MRRALVNLLRAACLFICIAAVILWIRSYHLADGIAWQRVDASEREIVSYAGGIHIRQLNPRFAVIPNQTLRRTIKEPVPANADWQTRAGPFSERVLWERAGFVVFAGHTQMLTLTGNNIYMLSGTVFTGNTVTNGSGTLVPLSATGMQVPARTSTMTTTGTMPGNAIYSGHGGGTAVFQADAMQLLVVIPYWFIVVMAALLPAVALLRAPALIRVRRRRKNGLCERCGYDLRACPERCAECGYRRDQE